MALADLQVSAAAERDIRDGELQAWACALTV